jgi:hypothetical protein
MKPPSMPLVSILLCAAGLFPRNASAGPRQNCGAIAVREQVEVPEGEVTLANLLAAGTCSAAVHAASEIRLGTAPLAGSPRVLRGDEVRGLLERIESGQDLQVLGTSVPERVTIRRAEPRTDCSNLAAPRATLPSDGTGKRLRTCATRSFVHTARSGNPSSNADLVHRGERVILDWDSSGIHITVPAVSLDGGVLGEQVRARIEPGGRMMRAVVVDRGQLRAGSGEFGRGKG